MDEMNINDKHIQRLIEWLRQNGLSEEKILECIEYITK